ncbi:conserved hypothetical protein [Desulfatibacillum aliphaticivorans]|uniref:TRAP transporter T-component n=1 Tax=Desulfatibacillum aliphaticivorans TaxID=218208 RepID=B8FIY9_DESAL|nr:TRAP transporter TatT component family protein [Desulfatibacillum aliphaticivorans]ACL04380.1 conserved hypothetical protein [Desulfatibacillum aliphaticivorans]
MHPGIDNKNAVLNKTKFLILAGVLLSLIGCTRVIQKVSQVGVSTGAEIFAGPTIHMMVDIIMDTDNIRLAREGIGGNMVIVTALAELHPNDLEIQSKAAYLHCCYGMLVENDDPRFASQLYHIARDCGKRALRTNKKFRDGMDSGKRISELVQYLDDDYVEALMWTASAKMLYLLQNRNDHQAQLEIPESLDMVGRAMEMDPDYLFGACQMFIGVYYALIPEFMGVGSGPENSAKMFQEARDVTDGKNLMVDLFEARFLSVTIGDKLRFEELMDHILKTDPKALEGGAMLNVFAQEQARYWLDKKKELF